MLFLSLSPCECLFVFYTNIIFVLLNPYIYIHINTHTHTHIHTNIHSGHLLIFKYPYPRDVDEIHDYQIVTEHFVPDRNRELPGTEPRIHSVSVHHSADKSSQVD